MDNTRTTAFELIRMHGFVEAQRMAAQWRDASSPGTITFALHNQLCKQLREFANSGACFRTCA